MSDLTTSSSKEVLEAIDLERLSQLMDKVCKGWKGVGRARRWNCPNPQHPDKTPSATVFPASYGKATARWKCHSCGAGGTAVDLITISNNVDWKVAMDELRRFLGMPIFQPQHPDSQTRTSKKPERNDSVKQPVATNGSEPDNGSACPHCHRPYIASNAPATHPYEGFITTHTQKEDDDTQIEGAADLREILNPERESYPEGNYRSSKTLLLQFEAEKSDSSDPFKLTKKWAAARGWDMKTLEAIGVHDVYRSIAADTNTGEPIIKQAVRVPIYDARGQLRTWSDEITKQDRATYDLPKRMNSPGAPIPPVVGKWLPGRSDRAQDILKAHPPAPANPYFLTEGIPDWITALDLFMDHPKFIEMQIPIFTVLGAHVSKSRLATALPKTRWPFVFVHSDDAGNEFGSKMKAIAAELPSYKDWCPFAAARYLGDAKGADLTDLVAKIGKEAAQVRIMDAWDESLAKSEKGLPAVVATIQATG